jgi:hypothetical protein
MVHHMQVAAAVVYINLVLLEQVVEMLDLVVR